MNVNQRLLFSVVTQIGHNYGYFTVVTDLPKYLSDVLKFNVKENGLYSSLPYVSMWIMTMIFGVVSDFIITRKILGITNSRKLFTTFAFVVPGLFLVWASFSGCNRTLAITLFTIAMGFMGAYYSGMKVNVIDIAPNYAGPLMAITNGVGSFSGIAAVSFKSFADLNLLCNFQPYVVGVLTPNRTVIEWRLVFIISCCILTFTNIVYLIGASAKPQPWNEPPKADEETEKAEDDDKK